MARHIYLRPGAGVGAMQKIYGGKQLLYGFTYCTMHIALLLSNNC